MKKSGFVSIIGRPNVGKSTLMNHMIGQKIAITSEKPQTTRNRIQTVYHEERGQIVFVDTPGIHKAKNKLGDYMVSAAEQSTQEVDLILWLTEAEPFIGSGDRSIAENLAKKSVPVFLVLNKIDKVSKEVLLVTMDKYKDLMEFAEIIPVSALTHENLDHLTDVIFDYLDEGPAYYDEDTITDQPEKQIIAELIREKALEYLKEEIPHGIAVSIESMKPKRNNRRLIEIQATVIVERDSHKRIVIGKQGTMLGKIRVQAKKEIEAFLQKDVVLELWIKVKKDWRDSDFLIKNFGLHNE
ncbi:MAG: GTPase Era [Lachnoclostridium sp.]|jgi:GTP-binding protein Era|nr:GTPase Era [Lachnoclostridium sp.]